MLNLGGIDNRPPKANQSLGRFRVARNVMPTPENTVIPRYDNAEPSGQSADIRCTFHITQYDKDILSLVSKSSGGSFGTEYFQFQKNYSAIPENTYLPDTPFLSGGMDYPQSVQSYRINNTAYFLSPQLGSLFKYDGVEISTAGCKQPVFSTSSYLAAGTRFLRVVQHVIDFDNNEPVSEFIQFPTSSTSVIVQTTGLTGLAGFTFLPSPVANTTPNTLNPEVIGGSNYFIGTAVYSPLPANQHFVISTTDTNIISAEKIGSYVIVASTMTTMNSMGFDTNQYYGLALKIKSVSPLLLDSKDAKLLTSNRVWITRDLDSTECQDLDGFITNGTRTFLSFWESTASQGIYYFRSLVPSFPESVNGGTTAPARVTITTTGTNIASTGHDTCLFTIGPSLNGWYDTTTKKLSFNSNFFYTDTGTPFFSMTKFQSMLLFANDQNIWFSDTSLGGWIEQSSGSSSITVGDREFGRITSICGTADFLFVGRERKNYYVTGNIVTGNYRVQEISESELGPWCNASSINVKDSVIFINTLGVFQLVSGGKVVKLSDKCPKNFDSFNSNNVNEDIVFRMSGTVSNVGNPSLTNPWSVAGLAVAYDAYRELLVFMKREDNNPCFVLHARTGEFYEWDGMFSSTPNMYANCIAFISGSYYLGQVDMDPLQNRAKISIEDKTSVPVYPQTNPIKLYTSWLTANEPSLEKELLQLKMFGRIDTTSTAGIKVRHYKDWNINKLITDATYFPVDTSSDLNNQVQFSHKKRMNSDKCLAASVGIEVTQADVTFELESFEVEFNPIQTGMKR